MSGPIIIRDLYKKYADNYALNGLNLTIDTGQIYGILGPNGSGKTTLLRVICSLLEMTSGYVRLGDLNPMMDGEKIKSIVGYVPETPALYESLTPLEYFSFICSVRGIGRDVMERRVRNLSEAFGITDKIDDFIGSLSFGTKQKVAIISARCQLLSSAHSVHNCLHIFCTDPLLLWGRTWQFISRTVNILLPSQRLRQTQK